jgi:hypothetical protein
VESKSSDHGRATPSGHTTDNLATQYQMRCSGGSAMLPSVSPLPHNARTFMEARFGADFGGVRLHTGPAPEHLNLALRARAVTYGSDIYLGEGKNVFESPAERRLLAHELTHVVQQTGGSSLRISRTPLSLQRYSWDEFTKDVGEVASSAAQTAQSVGAAVATGISTVAATVADVARGPHPLAVDWNTPPAMTLRAWARQLDSWTVQAARAAGPAGLFDVINVPDHVRDAASELGRNARMDVTPLVQPQVRPTVFPRGIPGGPIVVAILVFLAIMLWPNTTPESAEQKYVDEERKRQAEEQKKKKEEEEKERGKCRETIPALRDAIHATTIRELDKNAQNYVAERLGLEPRTKQELGDFYLRNDFFFFLAIVKQTKNTILKVCSVPNNTLASSAGNKHIGSLFHAEEIAAPPLSAELGQIPLAERAGATLFNVCQSRACAENARNPDGCTAVLENIRNTQLPGGQVVDEPTGFPPGLRALSDQALERALRRLIKA